MPDLVLSCSNGRDHAFDRADWDRTFPTTATVFLIRHRAALVHVGLASDLTRRLAGSSYKSRLAAAGFGNAELYLWHPIGRPYPHRQVVADVRATFTCAIPDLWPDENHLAVYRIPTVGAGATAVEVVEPSDAG